MKHMVSQVDVEAEAGRIFEIYFGDMRLGVLDIETTGINRWRDRFILGGLYDVDRKELHQVFAQNTDEEEEALRRFTELLAPLDGVITYNGGAFDMPFLAERAGRYEAIHIPALYDLDLYRVVKGYSPLNRLLPNLSQKTVESYMGLWLSRDDEIDGAESARLYREYVRTQDTEKEEKILLHNRDDVCQLTRLGKVIGKTDFHKAMFGMGFPVKKGGRIFLVEEIKVGREGLLIEGSQKKDPIGFRCYELDGYGVEADFRRHDGSFSLRIPVIINESLTAVDIRSAGLDEEVFHIYPDHGSGFQVIKKDGEVRYGACNHIIREYLGKLMGTFDKEENLWN